MYIYICTVFCVHKYAVAVTNVKAGLISHPQLGRPFFPVGNFFVLVQIPPLVFKGFATNPPQVGTSILKLASHSNLGTYSISFEDLKHAGEINPCTTMRSPSCKVTFRLLWSDGTVMHYWSIFEKANSYLVVGNRCPVVLRPKCLFIRGGLVTSNLLKIFWTFSRRRRGEGGGYTSGVYPQTIPPPASCNHLAAAASVKGQRSVSQIHLGVDFLCVSTQTRKNK